MVQDGKLYGRDFFYDVISKAIALPSFARDPEFQKNEFVVQLIQVRNFGCSLCAKGKLLLPLNGLDFISYVLWQFATLLVVGGQLA